MTTLLDDLYSPLTEVMAPLPTPAAQAVERHLARAALHFERTQDAGLLWSVVRVYPALAGAVERALSARGVALS